MHIIIELLFIAACYLFGSIPQLSMLARLYHIQLNGDYHASLWKQAGPFPALTGMLGEFAKGAIPVIIARYLNFDLIMVGLSGIAAVCGQMWPIFSRFDGEKGNTVGLAMAAALSYQTLLFALIPIAIGAGIRTGSRLFRKKSEATSIIAGDFSRSLPLGMLGGFLVLPLASTYSGIPPQVTLAFLILLILILIRRLTAGMQDDLKMKPSVKQFLERLLYDRSIGPYRA